MAFDNIINTSLQAMTGLPVGVSGAKFSQKDMDFMKKATAKYMKSGLKKNEAKMKAFKGLNDVKRAVANEAKSYRKRVATAQGEGTPFYDQSYPELAMKFPARVVQNLGEIIGGVGSTLKTGAVEAGKTYADMASLATDSKARQQLGKDIEKAGGVGKVAAGAAEMIGEVGQTLGQNIKEEYVAPEGVDQVEFLLKRGLYKPVTTATDISIGAGLAGKAAKWGSKAAKVAHAPKLARTLSVSSQGLERIAKVTNPYIAAGKGAKGVVSKLVNKLKADKLAKQSAVKNFLNDTIPRKALDSYLKPPRKAYRFGKDPGRIISKEIYKGNIKPTMSLNKLNDRLTKLKKTSGMKIGGKIDNAMKDPIYRTTSTDFLDDVARNNPKKFVNIKGAVDMIDKEIMNNLDEAAYVKRLTDFKNSLTKEYSLIKGQPTIIGEKSPWLNPKQAHDLKVKIGNKSKWTNQAFDNEMNQMQVKTYHYLNDRIDDVVPGIKKLQAHYGDLLTAEKTVQGAVARTMNKDIIGLGNMGVFGGGTLAGGAGVGAGAAIFQKITGSLGGKMQIAKWSKELAHIGLPKTAANKLAKTFAAIEQQARKATPIVTEGLPALRYGEATENVQE